MKKLLFLLALVTMGSGAYAQCTANFTSSSNGATVTFNNTSTVGNMVTYYWDFGDGNFGNAFNPSHTYANAGGYTVCLTVIDSMQGCAATFCDSVLVTTGSGGGGGGGGGGSCVADFNMSQSGSTVAFTNASTGTNLDYMWDFGDGNTSNTMDPTHTYSSNGTYLACLTVYNPQDSTCWDTYCDSVVVGTGSGNCNASFYWYLDSTQGNGQGGGLVWLINNSTGSNLTYVWDFGDGTTVTGQYPSHTYAQNGSYYVCLTVSDNLFGCTSTYCDTVSVLNRASGFSINVIDPASVGVEEEAVVTASDLYPNPVNDNAVVTISADKAGVVQISLVNTLGALVNIENMPIGIGANNYQLDMSNLPAGIYFLNIQSEGLNINATQKVIKN